MPLITPASIVPISRGGNNNSAGTPIIYKNKVQNSSKSVIKHGLFRSGSTEVSLASYSNVFGREILNFHDENLNHSNSLAQQFADCQKNDNFLASSKYNDDNDTCIDKNDNNNSSSRLFLAFLNNENSISEYQLLLQNTERKHYYKLNTLLKRNVSSCKLVVKNPVYNDYYLSCSKDGTVRIWKWNDRKLKATLSLRGVGENLYGSEVVLAVFDGSGTRLVVVYSTGYLAVFMLGSVLSKRTPQTNNPLTIYQNIGFKLDKTPTKIIFQKSSSSLLYLYQENDKSIHLLDLLQNGLRIGYWQLTSTLLDWTFLPDDVSENLLLATRNYISMIRNITEVVNLIALSKFYSKNDKNVTVTKSTETNSVIFTTSISSHKSGFPSNVNLNLSAVSHNGLPNSRHSSIASSTNLSQTNSETNSTDTSSILSCHFTDYNELLVCRKNGILEKLQFKVQMKYYQNNENSNVSKERRNSSSSINSQNASNFSENYLLYRQILLENCSNFGMVGSKIWSDSVVQERNSYKIDGRLTLVIGNDGSLDLLEV